MVVARVCRIHSRARPVTPVSLDFIRYCVGAGPCGVDKMRPVQDTARNCDPRLTRSWLHVVASAAH